MSSPAARRLTQVEVPVEQRWSTRVVLQPIAAPSVLGLAGLSVSLMMAGTLQAKWWGTQADLLPVSIFGFAFGGIAQLAAAMWAYRARDVAATLTHGAWGSYWVAFFVLQLWDPAGARFGHGLWIVGLAFVTLTAAAAREIDHKLMAAMRAVLTAGAATTAAGYLSGGFGSGWSTAGGWLFVIPAALGWAALVWLLLQAQRRAPIELAFAEPGVRRGQ